MTSRVCGVDAALVSHEVAALVAAVAAERALVATLLCVRALVFAATRVVGETSLTVTTLIRSLACVLASVHAQCTHLIERHAADVTHVFPFVLVAGGRVLGVALFCFEWLLAIDARESWRLLADLEVFVHIDRSENMRLLSHVTCLLSHVTWLSYVSVLSHVSRLSRV